jgi:hypothetical protein
MAFVINQELFLEYIKVLEEKLLKLGFERVKSKTKIAFFKPFKSEKIIISLEKSRYGDYENDLFVNGSPLLNLTCSDNNLIFNEVTNIFGFNELVIKNLYPTLESRNKVLDKLIPVLIKKGESRIEYNIAYDLKEKKQLENNQKPPKIK